MSRRGWIAAAAAALLAGAVAFAVLRLAGGSAPVAPPHASIGLVADVMPRTALFGGPLHATVDVVLDRRAVDPGSLALRGSFAPFQPAGPPAVTRSSAGPLERVRLDVLLECLQPQCLPPDPAHGGERTVRLPSVQLGFLRRDGRPGRLAVRWPAFALLSRLGVGEPQRLTALTQPPYRATLALPPVTYSVSPSLLLLLLAGGGALLLAVAGGVLLVGTEPLGRLAELRRHRRRERRTALERALAAVDRARAGSVEEQRKALEQLADALRGSGQRELAGSASTLAWAETPPAAEATAGLAAAVAERARGRTNGRGRARR